MSLSDADKSSLSTPEPPRRSSQPTISRWQIGALVGAMSLVSCTRIIDESKPRVIKLLGTPRHTLHCYEFVDRCVFRLDSNDTAMVVGDVFASWWIENPEDIPEVIEWTRVVIHDNFGFTRGLDPNATGEFSTQLPLGDYESYIEFQPPQDVLVEGELDEDGVARSGSRLIEVWE